MRSKVSLGIQKANATQIAAFHKKVERVSHTKNTA